MPRQVVDQANHAGEGDLEQKLQDGFLTETGSSHEPRDRRVVDVAPTLGGFDREGVHGRRGRIGRGASCPDRGDVGAFVVCR
jgi:hypothetical protein